MDDNSKWRVNLSFFFFAQIKFWSKRQSRVLNASCHEGPTKFSSVVFISKKFFVFLLNSTEGLLKAFEVSKLSQLMRGRAFSSFRMWGFFTSSRIFISLISEILSLIFYWWLKILFLSVSRFFCWLKPFSLEHLNLLSSDSEEIRSKEFSSRPSLLKRDRLLIFDHKTPKQTTYLDHKCTNFNTG